MGWGLRGCGGDVAVFFVVVVGIFDCVGDVAVRIEVEGYFFGAAGCAAVGSLLAVAVARLTCGRHGG